jgi:DNA helicase-2/ATP-dependent DNA helicase PcrA
MKNIKKKKIWNNIFRKELMLMLDNELEKEIQKEIQLEAEKQKLEETVEIIKTELINYIEKRKSITQYLIDSRKKAVEEYRDDEDKLIE